MKLCGAHKCLAVLAVAFWLLAGAMGAHAHLCEDEPGTASMHMHLQVDRDHHLSHHENVSGCSNELNVMQSGITHLLKIDMWLLPLIGLLLLLLPLQGQIFQTSYRFSPRFLRANLRPPLRAPPAPH